MENTIGTQLTVLSVLHREMPLIQRYIIRTHFYVVRTTDSVLTKEVSLTQCSL